MLIVKTINTLVTAFFECYLDYLFVVVFVFVCCAVNVSALQRQTKTDNKNMRLALNVLEKKSDTPSLISILEGITASLG